MSAQVEFKPADIILQQLGGRNRLKAMIGAKDIYSDNNGNTLLFKFMKGKNGANHVRITLDPSDTYTVEFIKIVKYQAVTVSKHDGIYWDMLANLFRDECGLYLSL